MPSNSYPRPIPVANLRPGMTVWKDDGKRFIRDVYLVDYLLGDYSPREWIRRIQFQTGNNTYAIWRPSGSALITYGKDDRKVILKRG